MGDIGQITPSISNICINFRTAENRAEILEKIYITPEILQSEETPDDIIEHKIFFEKGAPFIYLHTNLYQQANKTFN